MDKTGLVLVLNDNVTEKQLKELGFVKDSCIQYPDNNGNYHDGFTYEFLSIDPISRSISMASGVDWVNGDEELLKFYELVKLGYVHTEEVILEDDQAEEDVLEVK